MTFTIKTVNDPSKIKRKSRSTGSIYDQIVERAVELKEGASLTVDCPDEFEDIVAFRNSLNGRFRDRMKILFPDVDGGHFKLYRTEDDDCVEVHRMSEDELAAREVRRGKAKPDADDADETPKAPRKAKKAKKGK